MVIWKKTYVHFETLLQNDSILHALLKLMPISHEKKTKKVNECLKDDKGWDILFYHAV